MVLTGNISWRNQVASNCRKNTLINHNCPKLLFRYWLDKHCPQKRTSRVLLICKICKETKQSKVLRGVSYILIFAIFFSKTLIIIGVYQYNLLLACHLHGVSKPKGYLPKLCFNAHAMFYKNVANIMSYFVYKEHMYTLLTLYF